MKPLRTAIALIGVFVFSSISARADVVLDWNAIAVTTVTSQGQNPFAQARFLTIAQLAVFEAVNAVTGRYEPYLGTVMPSRGARADAAAIAAAYRVLKNYFPTAGNLDAAYEASLNVIPNGAGKVRGIAAGEAAAAQMIALRLDDGSAPPEFAVPASTDPGIWQLTPTCPPEGGTFRQWGNITPFGIPSVLHRRPWIESFRPAPPPALDSRKYAKDYNEVARVGNLSSGAADRPDDRATVARFFATASPSFVFNLAARQVAAAANRSLTYNARALALINMAANDSLIASFATKYTYNLWRPETAIRAGGTDDNDRTDPDVTFAPFVPTPCFPSYPSNHASASGGAAAMLTRLYGPDGHRIVLESPNSPGVTLRYETFDQITADIDDARVYGGIHFRFDQDAGGRLGRTVADYIYNHTLSRDDDDHAHP